MQQDLPGSSLASNKTVKSRIESADISYREASSMTSAVAAESTVASQFAIKFDACQASISKCAAES
jgi:hypothetical protein